MGRCCNRHIGGTCTRRRYRRDLGFSEIYAGESSRVCAEFDGNRLIAGRGVNTTEAIGSWAWDIDGYSRSPSAWTGVGCKRIDYHCGFRDRDGCEEHDKRRTEKGGALKKTTPRVGGRWRSPAAKPETDIGSPRGP